jgi:hypothetical protein
MTARFRAPVAAGIATATESAPADAPASRVGVDAAAGIIYGASAMQAVEALGHDVLIDQATLGMIAELGNAQDAGVKVRYTHPGLCGDGLGSYLGRMRSFRVVGDRVVGDIHLSDASASSPDGDLRAYVLQLAQDDPAAFGMSVVVEATQHWVMSDGSEIDASESDLRPADALADKPTLRPFALAAVDVVDEPAANRDGMFGRGAALLALARGTNPDAAEAFGLLDRLRDQLGFTAAQSCDLLARYLAARRPAAAALTHARLRELTKANPERTDTILDLAGAGADEAAILARLDADRQADLVAKSAALLATHQAMLAAKEAELAALRDRVAKAERLAGLATSAPADPGTGESDAEIPTFTRQQSSAGLIPSALLMSGRYRIAG